jgi:xanthine dehydrogenase accessory factor
LTYDDFVTDALTEACRWLAQDERVALATVVATRRSAPRPVGSKLAVSEAGELAGSVSGGCVESAVYEHAREVLAGGEPRLATYGISDELAFSVGLPCGGEIDVFVEEAERTVIDRLRLAVVNDERAVLFTVLEGGETGLKTLAFEGDETADEALRRGQSHVFEQDGIKVFADVFGPPPRLLVIGAIDTTEALCRAAKEIGWRTIVADPRGKFATQDRVPSADELLTVWPDEAIEHVRPDGHTAVLVLTHDDKFDLPALKGALASDAFYVGALGSRRNQERRRERLLEEGVSEEDADRIAGPCGLDIGAHTPSETAISMLAEMLAVRAGREGGPLKAARGRIHAEVG